LKKVVDFAGVRDQQRRASALVTPARFGLTRTPRFGVLRIAPEAPLPVRANDRSDCDRCVVTRGLGEGAKGVVQEARSKTLR
jgi:hypothetical protein